MQPEWLESIQKIWDVQERVQHVHPFLSKVFPIAIAEDGQFFIFDLDDSRKQYQLVKHADVLMPLSPKVRAAFPMVDYDGRMACVVTKDVFDSLSGYVTIFHEFIHCHQGETCESKLKSTLEVARKAQEANDYSWELTYPFPYEATEFVACYDAFLKLAEDGNLAGVLDQRRQLKLLLETEDYEYMVWQEWKEGFARFIENEIKRELGLDENHGGTTHPFTRVLFYEGGARFIASLSNGKSHLLTDIDGLFSEMFNV